MARTLISILLIIIITSSVSNAKEIDGYPPKLITAELGMGYLFAGGGLIGGIGLGQFIYPSKPEHAGGGVVGALLGFSIGGSIGVYTAGEVWGDDSRSDALTLFVPMVVGLSPLIIGNFVGNRFLVTWGTLLSPAISCATYNIVKRPESTEKPVYIGFTIML